MVIEMSIYVAMQTRPCSGPRRKRSFRRRNEQVTKCTRSACGLLLDYAQPVLWKKSSRSRPQGRNADYSLMSIAGPWGFCRYESRNEASFVCFHLFGKGRRGFRDGGFPISDEADVECQISLERMKLYAGSKSDDEPYRQHDCGDDPSPVAFDFGYLEFVPGMRGP